MRERYIGLMSGTSLDAVDAVLVEIENGGAPRLRATHAEPTTEALRTELLELTQGSGRCTLASLTELDQRVGSLFADAANRLLEIAAIDPATVTALGSHGQTIFHAPRGRYPRSLQIGDPNLIAAATGIITVADFRGADIVAGGQGAPLVPAFHHAVFTHPEQARCIVNIGGIANITLLPAGAGGSRVRGFDTGPGNALMDAWIGSHLGLAQDTDAQWAARGTIQAPLLQRWLQHPYFTQPPPKSTGRETFNLDWLRHPPQSPLPAPVDVQRSLVELTARTIADAISAYGCGDEAVYLCGGGAHNPLLRERLVHLLAPRQVADTGVLGFGADWVEAAAFAWLAMRTLKGLPGNMPAVTGAGKAVVLGGVFRPTTRPSVSNGE